MTTQRVCVDNGTSLQDNVSSVFDAIGYFETSPVVAVAVSGGADSMALLLLADAWVKNRSGRAVALTVDHGMRKESAPEAAQVHAWCEARGIAHHTLRWKPSVKATQEAARNARYTLLTEWCHTHRVLHLLTAHHQGDQAETLLFRLARGSGIDGLAGMAAQSVREGVRLLRPLLGVNKSELEDFLRRNHQPWLEDPTNATAKYARNVIRAQLTPDLSIQAAALAGRIGVVRHHMETHLAEAMARTISLLPKKTALIDMTQFKALPSEYRVRMLAALVQTIGGETTPPRTGKLERLHEALLSLETRTLGSCVFRYQPGKRRYAVKPERKTRLPAGFRPPKALGFGAFLGLNSNR